MRTNSALAALLLVGACQAGNVSTSSSPIINGLTAVGDPSVVALRRGNNYFCSGTLVEPNLVLTAAHCIDGDNPSFMNVSFGEDSRNPIAAFDVERGIGHRFYTGDFPDFFGDIAVLRLAEDVPASIAVPVPIQREFLDESYQDASVRVVGFGRTEDGSSGTKHYAELRIDRLVGRFIRLKAEGIGAIPCSGDSGGPTFITIDGEHRVLGVTSFGDSGCMQYEQNTRADAHIDDFLDEVMTAWGRGPCSLDGNCDPDADCEYIDPDCDPCGLNGTCGDGCAAPDRDCPIGLRTAEACSEDLQCESRVCLTADDDERVTYCSSTCDPNGGANECEVPFSACRQSDDGNYYCRYSGPTPGTQGARCGGGGDCLSGLCDGNNEICVEPCTSDADCSSDYQCLELGGENVCTTPTGGCSHQSQASLLALLFVLLALRRSQRRV